jgi:DNA-binding transcriptional regulator YiaG
MSKRISKAKKMTFGLEVVGFRVRNTLTQKEAAKRIGDAFNYPLSVRTLQNWEVGRTMPSGIGLAAVRSVIKR